MQHGAGPSQTISQAASQQEPSPTPPLLPHLLTL